jgi:Ni/Co efflux regulator RcnB
VAGNIIDGAERQLTMGQLTMALANGIIEVKSLSVPLTQQKQQTTEQRKTKMQKKTTKIKARDLKPAKDAKGGRRGHRGRQATSQLNEREGPGVQAPRGGYGIHMVQ